MSIQRQSLYETNVSNFIADEQKYSQDSFHKIFQHPYKIVLDTGQDTVQLPEAYFFMYEFML